MADPYRKVVLLSDEFSKQLAGDTYSSLMRYSQIKRLKIHGGIREFQPSDLRIEIQRNKELTPDIQTTVRGRDVYIFVSSVISEGNSIVYEPTIPIMRACLIADACREAGAEKITAVMPHMGYQRQERRTIDKNSGAEKREPISVRVTLEMLHCAGYTQLITLDPHFAAIKGFIPRGMHAETPTARVAITSYLQRTFNPNRTLKIGVASPDFGGGERAEIAARDIESIFLGLCRKRRPKAGQIGDLRIFFEEGIKYEEIDVAMIYDDLADTCKTMIKCADALKSLGIKRVIGVAPHPVFSDGAIQKLIDADLEMVVSNSIPLTNTPPNIHVVDLSTILGVTLHCITTGHGSLSVDIFDPRRYQKLEKKLLNLK